MGAQFTKNTQTGGNWRVVYMYSIFPNEQIKDCCNYNKYTIKDHVIEKDNTNNNPNRCQNLVTDVIETVIQVIGGYQQKISEKQIFFKYGNFMIFM